MDYQIKAIRVIILFLMYANFSNAQDCVIQKVPAKPFNFNKKGLISNKYDSIKVTDSNSYQIMLINFDGYSNKSQSYCLSIGLNNKINVLVLTEDSIVYSGCINTINKYNISVVKNINELNEFLVSECSSVLSSHTKQVMVICNKSLNIWIEYISMDGHMKETLETSSSYSYLKDAYLLSKKVFSDLLLWY